MPPKRKPSVSSPPSIVVTSPKTPTTAELAARMLDKYTVTTKLDSSPLLAKSKQIEAETPAIEDETIDKDEVRIPDAADDSGTEEASAKQGTAEKKTTALKRKATATDEAVKPAAKKPKPAAVDDTAEPAERKTTALKRKATPTNESVEPAAKKPKAAPTDEVAEPVANKQKATPPKRKATPRKPATAPRKRTKKEDYSLEGDPRPPPPPPLAAAIKRKISALYTFFDTHPARLPDHEAGSHVVSVDELDLLAALMILRVDYQLAYSTVADTSIEDASEMVVARMETGKASVDFNKTCDVERAAKATFAGRSTGLETVNLLEVEIDMLVAKRKQLAEDEMPAVGFRVYDDEGFDGAADHLIVEERPAEGDEHVLGESTNKENRFQEGTIEDVAVGEDGIEEDVTEDVAVNEAIMEQDILDAVADQEESVHEGEQEAVHEQDVDDESEEVSEEISEEE